MLHRSILCVACLLAVPITGCTSKSIWTIPNLQTPNLSSMFNPLGRFKQLRNPSTTDQLRGLAEQVADMAPQQQTSLARDLAARFASEPNPYVRGEILRVVGRMNSTEATDVLRRALQDDAPDVRVVACEALGKQANPEAIDLLAATLWTDQDIDVRLAATRALGGFHDPSATEALAAAVNDADPALQFRGVQSLRSSGRVDLGNRLSVWRRFVKQRGPENKRQPTLLATEPRAVF